ncbi:MAG: T9SS type A sorting domain-containing protein [Dysgonamonadaceae bacterium]|nr:T9SS type A sorting domain-containing protein [Dysgonamonadaceae bacterium]
MKTVLRITGYKCVKYAFLSLFLLMVSSSLFAQTRYYWTGKAGDYNWSTIGNWSSVSGGETVEGISQAPSSINTVVFDVNSGLGASSALRTISISGAVNCDSLIVTADCPNAPRFDMGSNSSNYININGSLLLERTGVSFYGANGSSPILKFTSDRSNETIQTNGTHIGGNFQYSRYLNYSAMLFSGVGSWRLINGLTCSGLQVQNGTLNLNGHNLTTMNVVVTGGKMVFPNVTITCTGDWTYTGGAALTSAETGGSLIRMHGGVFSGRSTDIYHNVEFYGNSFPHSIDKGQFDEILFSAGRGQIGTTAAGELKTKNLIIKASDEYNFQTITVSSKFEAMPPVSCGGQVWLRGLNATSDVSQRSITLGGSATVNVERAVINDLDITGGTSRTAVNSHNWGNNSGWTFTGAPAAGRNMYWIGGAGSWNDPAHWSTSSGGTSVGCIPTLADDVFFNAGSGTIGNTFATGICIYGTAWCKNMTINGVSGTPRLYSSGGSSTIEGDILHSCRLVIGGSLTLQEGMVSFGDGNSNINFVSNISNNEIWSKGVNITAILNFHSISGAGGWKLMDDVGVLNAANGNANTGPASINLYAGHLDLSGRQVVLNGNGHFDILHDNSISGFSGQSSLRTLNIAGSFIESGLYWSSFGGQKLTAAQSSSSLIINRFMFRTKNGDEYNNVEMIQFRQGWTSSLAAGAAGDGSGITSFNKIILSGMESHIYDGMHPDSLILAGNGTYSINVDITINKYLASSLECGGQTHLKSVDPARPITITMGTALSKSERVKVQNTIIENVSITPDGPYDITDCTLTGTSTGWKNTNVNPAKTYYWVGGTGDWGDPNHWSLIRGSHDGNTCIPRAIDNVVFDNNSFVYPDTLTLNISAYCNNMTWEGGSTQKPRFDLDVYRMYIGGSLVLQSGMTVNSSYSNPYGFYFASNRLTETIRTNGVTAGAIYNFNGTGGWKLEDALNTSNDIVFEKGTLNFNGQRVQFYPSVGVFREGSPDNRNNRNLRIEGAKITANGWSYTGNLQAEGSEIYIGSTSSGQSFTAETGARYHNLTLTTGSSYNIKPVNGGIYNKITALQSSIFNGIETDTLQLANNSNYEYQFTSGSTTTVKEAFYGSGTPCNNGVILRSTEETEPAIFDIKRKAANDNDNVLVINYARIHGIKALTNSDNARLHKERYCADENKGGSAPASWGYGKGTGNYNEGWLPMANYVQEEPRPFNGDRFLPCDKFPYTLTSANFAPTPETTFKWRIGKATNPVVSTEANLIIDGPETYFLTVDYGNKCESSDHLTITTGEGDSLVWTGAVGNRDWNDPANWYHPGTSAVSTFAPDKCIDVLIPAGKGNYPDLTPFNGTFGTDYTQEFYETAACNHIWFEHGGEVVRTDSLDYNRAFVELTLAANRWNMISAPLRYMYTGDYYKNDPCPHADKLRIYQQLFETANPQPDVAEETIQNATGGWTGAFNNPEVEIPVGFGYAVHLLDDGTAFNEDFVKIPVANETDWVAATGRHSIWFPKNDKSYNVYWLTSVNGDQKPPINASCENEDIKSTHSIYRGTGLNNDNNYRFVYEAESTWKTSGNVTLTTTGASAAGKQVIVGNPFMSHWDFSNFAAQNPGKIKDEYKVLESKDDAAYTTYSSLTATNKLIAPMQSVLITSTANIGTTELKTNFKAMAEKPGDKLKSASNTESSLLKIVVEKEDKSNSTHIMFDAMADNSYDLNKDSYKLFVDEVTKPVAVYTRSQDGIALDINVFGDTKEMIPLGVRTSTTGTINLRFEGVDNFYKLYLIDALHPNSPIDLKETPEYSFDKTTSGLFMDGRLFLSVENAPNSDLFPTQGAVSVFTSGKQLQVVSNSNIDEVQVFDMQGRMLHQARNIDTSTYTCNLSNSGMYVVKVLTGKDVTIKKVTIDK